MTKKYMVKETVNHWHEICADEELDIENIVDKAFDDIRGFNTGHEAIADALEKYKDKYGFEYVVKPNACGVDVIGMEVVEEID